MHPVITNILLKGGPFDNHQVWMSNFPNQYTDRTTGELVVYRQTSEKDSATGLPIFAFVASPVEPPPESNDNA